MRKPVDLRLYALIDPEQSGGHDLADLASRLVAGGVTLIQIRDKLSTTREAISSIPDLQGLGSTVAEVEPRGQRYGAGGSQAPRGPASPRRFRNQSSVAP